VRFRAFPGKGDSKTPQIFFRKKSMSKTFPKNRQNFGVSFPLDFFFFFFYCGFGCFSAMSSKTPQKKGSTKETGPKSFYKAIGRKIPTRFFLGFVLSRSWMFLGEGSPKTSLLKQGDTGK
jgi:hypothetical protein